MSNPELPDHTGKAPKHVEAATKHNLSTTLRTPIVTPVTYKKEYREALKRLNELKDINIPESEIGNLYNWRQVSNVPTLKESNNLTVIYIDLVNAVRKGYDLKFKLKALHILNERTGLNIPDKYVNEVQKGYAFPGAENYFDIMKYHNLFIDIKNELRKPTQKPIPAGFEVCGRCGGSGRYSFNTKDLDKCYGCGGSGSVPIKKKL